MGAIVTDKQSNMSWTITWKAAGRYPIVADRIYDTLADAQAYVDDLSATASAVPGLVLSVVNDGENNGIYFVQSIATENASGVLVKAGTAEKLSASNYAEAVEAATAERIGEIIYVAEETEDGKAGLYVITGAGSIERLGTTTATGDIAGDVAQLQTDVDTLEGAIDAVDKKVDAIDLTPYAKTADVNDALDKKVSTEGYIAYTQEEKDKLAIVQENVIEQIIYNDEVLTVDKQTKSVSIKSPEIKVKGIADGERIISLDENGKLGTTVGITYYANTEGETPVYEIRLTGKDGEVISKIDAKSFVKDGMLTSAELKKNPADQPEGTYLVLTWNTEAGVSEPMYVPVTDLIDVYTAGDGIAIENKVVTAKVKSNDEFIEVTAEGIASKGISTAILTAKNEVIGSSDDTSAALTLQGVKKYAESLVNTHTSDVIDVLAAYKVKDIDTTASNGVSLSTTEAGVVKTNVDVVELGASLVGATGEVGSVSGLSVKLGQAITDGAENPTEIISSTTSVQAAIQTLAGQIQAAVAGGITGIDGGEYITVGGTATNKKLTLDVAKIGQALVDNSSALKVDSDNKLSIQWEDIN